MMIIRPNIAVLTGAALSLVAGAAVYGAVATANATTSISLTKPVKASVATTPASAARCGADQELENGICVLDSRNNVDGATGSAATPAPAPTSAAAGCAADLELEDGVCVPHSRSNLDRSASSASDGPSALPIPSASDDSNQRGVNSGHGGGNSGPGNANTEDSSGRSASSDDDSDDSGRDDSRGDSTDD